MDFAEPLYRRHLDQQLERISGALAAADCDHLWIDNGSLLRHFADDSRYPFRANPYLAEIVPLNQHPDCHLIASPGARPRLLIKQSEDIWHSRLPVPPHSSLFDIEYYRDPEQLSRQLPRGRIALISAATSAPDSVELNPSALLNALDYARAVKSDYAIAQLQTATVSAARGHAAAREAFYAGASELEIHALYQHACGQSDNLLPYDNIVATDQHAAVLHHTVRDSRRQRRHSLLLDAGASHAGYACDITRSYAGSAAPQLYRDLIDALDSAQQQLAATLTPGTDFIAVQAAADQIVASLLSDSGLVAVSATQAQALGLVAAFFPHGVGHLLGVQVHDRGGHLCDSRGGRRPPPPSNPMLRCTRQLEANMVLTVEPGIYFIPQLLDGLSGASRVAVNWRLLDTLLPCGGIRIEDNVVVGTSAARNISREVFAQQASL